MSVRIVDVRDVTRPISSPIRNAYIDFTKMTASLVAVVTDVVRDGRRVVGYGFNSNGRYGQGGLIRERFRGRVLEAGRSRRALGRGRHHRHGGVGRGRQDRRKAAVPPAGRAPRPRGRPARVRL